MSILRIIDANTNRAREALRVMEEAARFVLEDAALAAELKEARHGLRAALPLAREAELHRDTPGDVGTALTTEAEADRGGVADVASAAGKRLSEALRVLEEYGKACDGCDAAALKQLRYRGYDLEARLNAALRGRPRRRQWRVCVVLTRSLCVRPWALVLEEAVSAGADCVQVREKDAQAGELLSHARDVVRRCRGAGEVAVIVNDRPDVALLAGADGVHLGQDDLPCAAARKLVGPELLIGVSTSSLAEAQAARGAGADYCGVGPMFATATKVKPVTAGPDYLRGYTAWNGLPHLAIGGITPGNVAALKPSGVRGVAVSRAVCAAERPAEVVRALLGVLS